MFRCKCKVAITYIHVHTQSLSSRIHDHRIQSHSLSHIPHTPPPQIKVQNLNLERGKDDHWWQLLPNSASSTAERGHVRLIVEVTPAEDI